eukprot:5812595-Pleurochrysis_carterae.AAC.1
MFARFRQLRIRLAYFLQLKSLLLAITTHLTTLHTTTPHHQTTSSYIDATTLLQLCIEAVVACELPLGSAVKVMSVQRNMRQIDQSRKTILKLPKESAYVCA